MEVFKVKKNSNYTTINNTVARDKRLSLKAKGFFLIIMTLPESWDFSINGIITITKEGKTAIYSAVNELIKYGYCKRSYKYENREGKKVRSNVVYTFYEVSNNKGSDLNSGNLNLGYLNLDNQPQLSTYNNKILKREYPLESLENRKKKFKQDVISHSKEFSPDILEGFYNHWSEPDKNKTKMRFEGEKYFQIENRLKGWAKREKVYNPPKPRL